MSSAWPLEVVPLSPVSCGTVVWKSRGSFHITVLVKATIALKHDGDATVILPPPIEREDRYRDKDPALSVRRASDIAPYLPSTGVVLTGHAHAPSGPPVSAVSARLSIFREATIMTKTIHVFGDVPEGASAPLPFQRMPLIYERAYGGPRVEANPVGVGAAGSFARPNLVDPADPTKPAGFGPIARLWPQRARVLGVLDERAPFLVVPDGFDFQAFNPAPLDQQIPFLQGDEWIVLEQLSASRPRFQTRLPSARARAQWHIVTAGGASAGREIALALDTLAIDGDKHTASLLWRGSFGLELLDLLGNVRVFAGLDVPDHPIAWPERRTIAPRVELPGGPTAFQQTSTGVITPFVGSAMPFIDQETTISGKAVSLDPIDEKPFARHLGEQTVIGASPIPRSALPFGSAAAPSPFVRAPSPPPIDEPSTLVDGYVDRIGETTALGADDSAALRAIAPFALATPGARAPGSSVDFPGAPWSSAPHEPLVPPGDQTARGPSPIRRAVEPPAYEAAPPPLQHVAAVAVAAAPAFDAPSAAHVVVDSEGRRQAQQKLEDGKSFDEDDLSGVDLSGLDFSGRSLARCKLRGAKLVGARLDGAKLTAAQMVEVDLTDATLENADLGRADLSRAIVTRARFDGAKLVDTNLSSADGVRASFRRATGQRTIFAKGTWSDANFDACEIAAANFSGASLLRASLRRSILPEARFNDAQASEAVLDDARIREIRAKGVTLTRASLRGADAQSGTFMKALLGEAVLSGANLKGANFSEAGCIGASFEGADLSEAQLEDAELGGARFAEAKLEKASLSRANAEGADCRAAGFGGADLKHARFARASFEAAQMQEVHGEQGDFTDASFARADLCRASLRGAIMKGANLAHSLLDGTDLRNADLERANVHGASRKTAKMAGANTKDLDERDPEKHR